MTSEVATVQHLLSTPIPAPYTVESGLKPSVDERHTGNLGVNWRDSEVQKETYYLYKYRKRCFPIVLLLIFSSRTCLTDRVLSGVFQQEEYKGSVGADPLSHRDGNRCRFAGGVDTRWCGGTRPDRSDSPCLFGCRPTGGSPIESFRSLIC